MYQVCAFMEVYLMLSFNYTSNRSFHLSWSPDTNTHTHAHKCAIEEKVMVQTQCVN